MEATRWEDLPELLTVQEARRVLRVGKNAIYDLIAQKRIPAVRLGRSLRVPKRALERMIEQAASDE